LGTRRSNLDVIFKLNTATLPVNDFTKPYAFQYQGSWLARRILALMGWRVQFEGFPTRQGVAVVYPHTSNWDFPVMVLAKWAIGVQVMFWGKDKLFDVPVLGAWMRWIGGVPVNRTAPGGVVGQAWRLKARESRFLAGAVAFTELHINPKCLCASSNSITKSARSVRRTL
jgi:1-acyl-sn-glycerol-3-phosphate acyltransferase